jgi:hypothetical protein
MQRARSRSGVSAFELVMLLALLFLAAALLFPAMMKVRQRAADSRKLDSVRSLGVAFHIFHDQHNMLPCEDGTSVFVHILPHLETTKGRPREFGDKGASRKPVEVKPKEPTPFEGYVFSDRRSVEEAGFAGDFGFYADPKNRMLTVLSQEIGKGLPLIHISNRDGASNTMLLTLKGVSRKEYKTQKAEAKDSPGSWVLPWDGKTQMKLHHVRTSDPSPVVDGDDESSNEKLGGPNARGTPAIFVDGSVRMLKNGLEQKLALSLWQWNDGMVPESETYQLP